METSLETDTQEKTGERQRAILFELEYIAVQGRDFIFGILKDTLKKEGINLSMPMFSQYCTLESPQVYIPKLLQANNKSISDSDKLINNIISQIKNKFEQENLTQTRQMQNIIRTAEKFNAKIGALSVLSLDLAESLVDILDLTKHNILVKSSGSGLNGYIPPDAWKRLSKFLEVPALQCIAIGTYSASCRSAIAAHMKFIALPDEYTLHQDFSGSDHIMNELDPTILENLLSNEPGFTLA